MKKIATCLILISGTAFLSSAQTIWERVELAGEIKVYFRNKDIEHNPNTNSDNAGVKLATECKKFDQKTPLPLEYINACKEIIPILNKGFNTNAFVEGDISYLSSLPVDKYGELDWLRLGESLTFFVSTSGYYTVKKYPNTGKENSLEIQSFIYVFSVSGGKLKTLASSLSHGDRHNL